MPVPLPAGASSAAPSRAHADAARERISDNTRRPASTRLGRFWQLSGGVAWCGVCGSVLSSHQVHRSYGKIDGYYRCYQRYNTGGPRDCTNTAAMPAAALEQTVWEAVYDLLSDPERLKRQHREHVERRRREMRGDPGREARELAQRLEKLDQKEGYLLDLAADTSMPKERLRTKLAEFEEQRKELLEALGRARGRRQSIEELEQTWQILGQLLDLDRITLLTASPQDRRRLYGALRLRVEVDEDRAVRLSGIFDPDLYLPGVLKDPPADPSEPVPKALPTAVEGAGAVVTLDHPSRGT